jgi:putative toxin-antitoxin system antitoxin component (TIGR02293 family)
MKKKKVVVYKALEPKASIAAESSIAASKAYVKVTVSYLPQELSYAKFKRTLDANCLTMAEWAALLQISERTLHRYAKDDLSFNSILHERISLITDLLKQCTQVFGNTTKQWLLSTPPSFGGKTPFDFLYTQKGIERVMQVLHSMQYGVVA